MEADFLDSNKNGVTSNNRTDHHRCVQGVEFDAIGTRHAYWLFPEHPGNAYGALDGRFQSKPIPAGDIAHIYEKQRVQVRGVPWGLRLFAP